MSIVEVASMSSKGQIVVPGKMRRAMGLEAGTKFIVVQDGDSILMRPIAVPKKDQFNRIIAMGDRVAESLSLTEYDVQAEIEAVRKAHESSD